MLNLAFQIRNKRESPFFKLNFSALRFFLSDFFVGIYYYKGMSLIKSIVISGATHRNEKTGVELVRKWQSYPEIFEKVCPSANVQLVLANPLAMRLNRRYVNQDLNRSFSENSLSIQGESLCYEINRAKELNEMFGKKGKCTKTDLLIDVHNTTSNMGACLILSEKNPFTTMASAEIVKEFSETRIYFQPEERLASPYFGTIAKADICLEVGPQAHGTLLASLFELTEKIVLRYLELVEDYNKGLFEKREAKLVEVFTQWKDLDYPRDASGNICAMIHPDRQGADFKELKEGDKIFKTFDGQDILYHGETVFPVFVNEAAYYEKKIAMSLTKRTMESW
mgnify:FL=1